MATEAERRAWRAAARLQARRRRIVREIWKLKRDVDSYNENNTHGGHFDLVVDFTEDIAEAEQPPEFTQPKGDERC